MFSLYHENIRDINNSDLTKETLPEFNELIKNIEKHIKEQIMPYADIPKAVFIGMTSCGKSSLLCCLSKKKLLIKGKGKIMHLEGEGIGIGLDSFTTIPMPIPEMNGTIIFVDSPGFEDVKGFKQEILNAFSIDNIFKNYDGHKNQFKIILVISQDEFYTNRGIKMANSFLRLEEMFPIGEKLKENIGLVITKGYPAYDGHDYIIQLNEQIMHTEDPPKHLVRVCNFFLNNPDRVFAFPSPSFEDKDKQYDFKDHESLIKFLHDGLLTNPDHKISISAEAKLRLKLVRDDHLNKLSNTVKKLCDKINKMFSQESNANELQKWYDIINNLAQSDIKKSQDLQKFLNDNIQNCEQYKKDIEEIEEFEIFDEFIDRILYSKVDTSCLSEVIHAWCYHAIDQLHKYVMYAIDSENSKEKIEIEERLRKESEEKIEKLQRIMEQREREMREKENQLLAELKRQSESHQANIEQIKALKEDISRLEKAFKEREENERRLREQLAKEAKEREESERRHREELAKERNKKPEVVREVVTRKVCLLI